MDYCFIAVVAGCAVAAASQFLTMESQHYTFGLGAAEVNADTHANRKARPGYWNDPGSRYGCLLTSVFAVDLSVSRVIVNGFEILCLDRVAVYSIVFIKSTGYIAH